MDKKSEISLLWAKLRRAQYASYLTEGSGIYIAVSTRIPSPGECLWEGKFYTCQMVLSHKVMEYMWNTLPPNLTDEVKCCGWGIYILHMYLSFLFSYIGIAAPLTPSRHILKLIVLDFTFLCQLFSYPFMQFRENLFFKWHLVLYHCDFSRQFQSIAMRCLMNEKHVSRMPIKHAQTYIWWIFKFVPTVIG